MLITELKSKEAISALVNGKVFIVNCHGCKEVHFPEAEADALQKEMMAAGQNNQSTAMPDGSLHITRCPWHTQFVEMGLREAGMAYCRVLDSAISQGFNPELGYVVEQTLHTHDCCIHRLTSGPINEGVERGKNPAGLRDFAYHCAHSYWSYREVSIAIFGRDGQDASRRVLEDFSRDYGQDMTDVLLSYETVNFNVCD